MTPTPLDLALRILRLLLAVWLLVGPFLLGLGGTFAQRQDGVAGLLLLPAVALGLLAPGVARVALLVIGGWLLFAPDWSLEYFRLPERAAWHDRIVGLAALFLALLPLWSESVVVDEPGREERTRKPRRLREWSPSRALVPWRRAPLTLRR